MRIAVISDIHHLIGGPRDVISAVKDFVAFAQSTRADVLVDLGDRLRDVSPTDDREALKELADIFSCFRGPRCHLLGNHDVINLKVEDHTAILGVHVGNRVLEFGSHRLIAWQPDVSFETPQGFNEASPDLPWLEKVLRDDPRAAVVATHYPISGQSMIGNRYFEDHPHQAFPPDHANVRAALERSPTCAVWLSGHIHQNGFARIGQTSHVSVQSASENLEAGRALCFGLIDLSDRLEITIQGRDWFEVRCPM